MFGFVREKIKVNTIAGTAVIPAVITEIYRLDGENEIGPNFHRGPGKS